MNTSTTNVLRPIFKEVKLLKTDIEKWIETEITNIGPTKWHTN